MLAEHEAVDVVVNNAGKSIRRSLELSYDRYRDFDRTMAVNYSGPVRLMLALLPAMREQGDGHVVNISTLGVLNPSPRYSAYLASKAAFDTWVRCVAPELRGDGVDFTSMYFGLVHTRMSAATAMYRYMPGLTPAKAADDVCWALVRRPLTAGPGVGEVGGRLRRHRARAGRAAARGLLPRVDRLGVRRRRRRHRDSRARRLAGAGRAAMSTAVLYGRAGLALVRAGVIAPMRPDRALRMIGAARGLGVGAATAVAAGAARHPARVAIADDDGVLTWAELDARGAALASTLPVGPDGRLAIMCRNGRAFLIAMVAAARIGCDVVLLNTEFAAPQLAELLPREQIDVAVADR